MEWNKEKVKSKIDVEEEKRKVLNVKKKKENEIKWNKEKGKSNWL